MVNIGKTIESIIGVILIMAIGASTGALIVSYFTNLGTAIGGFWATVFGGTIGAILVGLMFWKKVAPLLGIGGGK